MSDHNLMRRLIEAKELLGIGQSADEGDLRLAWRRIAFEMHPDRGGNPEDFERMRAAYDLLRAHGCKRDKRVVTAPPSPKTYQRRPMLKTRVLRVNDRDQESCRDALKSETDCVAHVPSEVRKKGRRVSLIVRAPLAAGANQVALPVGELAGRRDAKPGLLRFRSPKGGPGTIVMPDQVRASLVPGASSVRIHFDKG